MSNQAESGNPAEENSRQFGIQKIYLRDVSFETPNSPAIFSDKWDPQVNLELSTNGQKLGDDAHEVVLTLTVTAKVNDKTAYLVEVQQAGIFNMMNFPDQELGQLMGSFCPNILFPYAREAVSALVAKGGFPQLVLAPVNFDALYAQHMQRLQAGQNSGEAAAQGSPAS